MNRREFLTTMTAAAAPAWATPADDLAFASAVAAADAIRGKKLSAVELTKSCFARIARLDPKLNSIVVKLETEALARAREADAALAQGRPWGPLHGVPVTIKESFAVAGTPTTWGRPELKDDRAPANAIAVDRLLRAGAIVAGKTNVPLMLMDWQSYNAIHGVTNNPWDLARTPGGSSGGSAAALAAGLGYISLGSDIGGSVRVPAHFCGIYAHKPTVNLIPLGGHEPAARQALGGETVDLPVAGPMARAAEDLRVALEVMGGPSGEDAVALSWKLPGPRQARLPDFRIGYVIDDPYSKVASDTLPALEAVLRGLERTGAKLERGWPEGYDPAGTLGDYMFLLAAQVVERPAPAQAAGMRAAWEKDPNDPFLAALFEPHTRWRTATASRLRARAAWRRYFETHDVFLMPAAISAAYPHNPAKTTLDLARTIPTPEGPRPYIDIIHWQAPASFTGLPSTVAPAGRTAGGLPVGIQVLGPLYEDGTPIRFAELLTGIAGGFTAPPGFA
jgi:amidase